MMRTIPILRWCKVGIVCFMEQEWKKKSISCCISHKKQYLCSDEKELHSHE